MFLKGVGYTHLFLIFDSCSSPLWSVSASTSPIKLIFRKPTMTSTYQIQWTFLLSYLNVTSGTSDHSLLFGFLFIILSHSTSASPIIPSHWVLFLCFLLFIALQRFLVPLIFSLYHRLSLSPMNHVLPDANPRVILPLFLPP